MREFNFYLIAFIIYLIKLCIPHGGEVKPSLPALVLKHVIQQLGGRLHIVPVVMLGVVGGAVKQTHYSLGALTVHPGTVATQLLVLEEGKLEG